MSVVVVIPTTTSSRTTGSCSLVEHRPGRGLECGRRRDGHHRRTRGLPDSGSAGSPTVGTSSTKSVSVTIPVGGAVSVDEQRSDTGCRTVVSPPPSRTGHRNFSSVSVRVHEQPLGDSANEFPRWAPAWRSRASPRDRRVARPTFSGRRVPRFARNPPSPMASSPSSTSTLTGSFLPSRASTVAGRDHPGRRLPHEQHHGRVWRLVRGDDRVLDNAIIAALSPSTSRRDSLLTEPFWCE
jgi:hypothetical protein